MIRPIKIDKEFAKTTPPDVSAYAQFCLRLKNDKPDYLCTKEELINNNLRFVISVAKTYPTSIVPLWDLIQYGNIGLIEAAERYDGTRKIKFISYAVMWIRQAIMSGFQKEYFIKLPCNQHSIERENQKLIDAWEQENETISREKYNTTHPSSLDIIDEDGHCPINDITSSYYDVKYHDNIMEIVKLVIRRTVFSKGSINAQIQNILIDYIDYQCDRSCYEDLSVKYHVTKERIRQIIAKFLPTLHTNKLIKSLYA